MKKLIKLIVIFFFLVSSSFANTIKEQDIYIYEGSKIKISDAKRIIEYIKKNENEVLAWGYAVNFYKVDKYGISESKKEYKIRDFYARKYLKEKKIKNIPKTYGAFKYKENYYIIADYFNGNYGYIKGITTQQLKNVMNTLFGLDKLFFYHKDLHVENILFSQETNKINIIDFDSIYYIDNNGSIQIQIENNDVCSKKSKCLYSKINNLNDKLDLINPYADNIFLYIPSNINSLENRFLGKMFLSQQSKNNQFLKFDEYLKVKALYIEKRHNFYSKILLFSRNKADNINELKFALKIDKAIANVLKKETHKIKELEKIKMKIREQSIIIYWGDTTNPAENKEKIKKLFLELRNEIKKIENSKIDNRDFKLYIFSVKKWIEVWEPISLN